MPSRHQTCDAGHFISCLFESGLTLPEVCLISGHLSWTTIKRYTHLQPQQVLEKLDARS